MDDFSAKITKCENGYVVEFRDPSKSYKAGEKAWWTEVYPSLKDAVARVLEFFA